MCCKNCVDGCPTCVTTLKTSYATLVAHKHAAVIKAWADGASVQYRLAPLAKWGDISSPSWTELYEYRIKPEPKPDFVRYACAKGTVYNHMDFLACQKNAESTSTYWASQAAVRDNIKATFDGETGELKSVEMI